MKSKGSASLYEVLKSASRAGSEPPSGPAPSEATAPASDAPPSLKERLAAYKAQKLAEAQAPFPIAPAATAVAEPTPVPLALPEPAPAAAPIVRVLTPVPSDPEPRSATGPGERVLRLTYNTAAFALLVVVGLLFVAYAIGVKTGKGRVAETAPEMALDRPASPAPAPVVTSPAIAPPKVYTIHLAEWPARKPEERLKAAEAADTFKKALEKRGIKNVETLKIMRGGEERLALYVDRFKDTASEPARSRISELQKFKVQNQMPFAQASFEEVPK